MPTVDRNAAPLAVHTLRTLSLEPGGHPRGQSHLSAASGLVCHAGRVYVIGDDELHLAVFADRHSPGVLHRVFEGALPKSKKARKRAKPDLETLLWWPSAAGSPAMVALGSGSRQNRQRGVLITLDADGLPATPVQPFELAPLYQPLREEFDSVNIEGAFVLGDELVLLNRGLADGRDNAAVHYRLSDVQALVLGDSTRRPPRAVHHHRLGGVNGVALGFTDGKSLGNDGRSGWAFTAVAEDSVDAVADGGFLGSVVGMIDGQGVRVAQRRLAPDVKVEGIAVHRQGRSTTLCLVTDADDPKLPSSLLLATW